MKNEELGRDFSWIQRTKEAAFQQNLSKNIALKSSDEYTFYRGDLVELFKKVDCSCFIYLNGELYKEIKMENPYKYMSDATKEETENFGTKPSITNDPLPMTQESMPITQDFEETAAIKEARIKAEEKKLQEREEDLKNVKPSIDSQIEEVIQKANTMAPVGASNRNSKNIENGISGRTMISGLEKPKYKVDDYGTVVVDIIVDLKGNVIKAEIGKGTNTPNKKLREAAIEAAKKQKYNEIDSDENQKGSVTYKFNLN